MINFLRILLMFLCDNCKKKVKESGNIGTLHRNHCPYCLFSKHLDSKKPGDRESKCRGKMEPIALAYKKDGEIMLVHKCEVCADISTNRISADDNEEEILNVFNKSILNNEQERFIQAKSNLRILGKEDETEVRKQLFGI